jgi:predicted N-acetyltransferase YhbS
MTELIRPATESDLDAMAALAVAREQADARNGPGLFEAVQQADPEADQIAVQRRMMAMNMQRAGHVALVAEDGGRVVGFAVVGGIGLLPPSPDDGLTTATLGSFDVEPDRWPTAAPVLLGAALDGARSRGVGMLLAQSTAPEAEKRRLFESVGMRVTVETWWMPLAQRDAEAEGAAVEGAASAGAVGAEVADEGEASESAAVEGPAGTGGVRVRSARAMDVDAMVTIEEAHRTENARRDSEFIAGPIDGATEVRRRVLTEWIASPDADILIAEADGRLVGYTLVVDMDSMGGDLPASMAAVHELTIEPEQWPSAGRALLYSALDAARRRGAAQVLVMTDPAGPARRDDLTAAGLTVVAENWRTRLERRGE